MKRLTSRKALAVASAALVVAGGSGAAIAASKGSSPTPSAFFDAVAKHLGISTDKLRDATKAAAIDQVDAALAAGTITKAQADQLKARIQSGGFPFLGPGFGSRFGFGPGGFHRFGHGLGTGLSAAASYLGLSVAQLGDSLAGGKSLADVAKAQGKSVDGLKQAIVDAAKKKLDQAVSNGALTSEQEQSILARLESRVDELVNGTFRGRHSLGHFFGAPSAPLAPASFFGPPV